MKKKLQENLQEKTKRSNIAPSNNTTMNTTKIETRKIFAGIYEVQVLPANCSVWADFDLMQCDDSKWRLRNIGGVAVWFFDTKNQALEFCRAITRTEYMNCFQD
jgi:inner membrane protein involved in colicin E2 resistance